MRQSIPSAAAFFGINLQRTESLMVPAEMNFEAITVPTL